MAAKFAPMDFRGGLGEGFRVKLLRRIDGELRVLAFRLMLHTILKARQFGMHEQTDLIKP